MSGDRYVPMSFFKSLEDARTTLREESLLALEKQIEYLEFLAAPRSEDFFEVFAKTYGGTHHVDMRGVARYLRADVRRLVGEAPTYFVSKDMTEMIRMAAEDMPRDGLSPADLLTPSGFLYFHHPIEVVGPATPLEEADDDPLNAGFTGGNFGPTSATEKVGIRAIAWEQTDTIVSQGQSRPGVAYYLFHDPEHLAASYLRGQVEEMEAQLRASGMDLPEPIVHQIPEDVQRGTLRDIKRAYGPLTLYDYSGWTYGRAWELVPYDEPARPDTDVQGVHPVVDQVRCLLSATWKMLNQKIVHLGSERPPRAMRRRASRLMPETGDVVVIRLRKEYHPEGSEEQALANAHDPDAEPWFTHRHLVRGHWRRQPYGDGSTSLIWIAPYVRGPEDRPLIIKSKVWSLEK